MTNGFASTHGRCGWRRREEHVIFGSRADAMLPLTVMCRLVAVVIEREGGGKAKLKTTDKNYDEVGFRNSTSERTIDGVVDDELLFEYCIFAKDSERRPILMSRLPWCTGCSVEAVAEGKLGLNSSGYYMEQVHYNNIMCTQTFSDFPIKFNYATVLNCIY